MEERYNFGRMEKDAQQYWSGIDAYRAVEHDPRFPRRHRWAPASAPAAELVPAPSVQAPPFHCCRLRIPLFPRSSARRVPIDYE